MPASRHFFVSSKNAFAGSAMIGIVEASGRSKERIFATQLMCSRIWIAKFIRLCLDKKDYHNIVIPYSL